MLPLLRHYVRVHFQCGDTLETWINGSLPQVREYYAPGRSFNLGDGAGGDRMAIVQSLEILARSYRQRHRLLNSA